MAKPSIALTESFASKATISEDIPEEYLNRLLKFLERVGISGDVPDHCNTEDFYSNIIGGFLKHLAILRGRVTCLVSVKPAVTNTFGGFHGGAIASVAEAVAFATARTIVAEDKELFLGELSISYLSTAPKNAEVIVDGSVVRSGRNITVVEQEFKLKKTGNLVYTARATFYHMPVSKL
ncbi:PREDICTED: uncharacterized protein LOC101315085 [Fragaria vesca subsp. vesca]|uniref:uncharacterized protein LOC101315085 n=1 Tax=Fragaria vesca subsp. vesca TaxID=101020 RepID=UPI0002C2E79B|nr:PREDICTED: uncharacterized protein LOC101315085 [Fragaria vesca subsp. vesca]